MNTRRALLGIAFACAIVPGARGATSDFTLTATGPSTWDANRKATFNFTVKLNRSTATSADAKICIGNTGAFEWDAGSPAPTTLGTFNTNQQKTASGTVKAKGTFTQPGNVNFHVTMGTCPATTADSNTVAANLGPGSTTTTASDLETSVTSFKLDGETNFVTSLPNGQLPAGNKLTIRVTIKNNGPGTSAPVRLSMSRLDHTCGGYPAAVGSFQTVDALASGASVTRDFQDTSPPTPGAGNNSAASQVACYKTGIGTSSGGSYTDSNNNNHTTSRSVTYVAVAGGGTTAGVKFGDYLHAKFQNAKCLDCHSFTDNNSAKRSAHNSASRTSTTTTVTSAASCSGCHNSQSTCAGAPGCVANWYAAGSGMNWSGKSAKDTCLMIKQGSFANKETMRSHLKTDALILWALGRQNVSTTEWNGRVDAWVNNDMKCE